MSQLLSDDNYQGDLLSSLLSSIQVSETAMILFELFEPWAIDFEYNTPVSFTVVDGEFWLFEDKKEPRCYTTGDTFVYPRGTFDTKYTMSSSYDEIKNKTTPKEMFENSKVIPFDPQQGSLGLQKLKWGDEGEKAVTIFSFAFSWSDEKHGPFVAALPELISVDSSPRGLSILRLLMDATYEETERDRAGADAIAKATAQLFLVHILRTYALLEGRHKTGWLNGFTNPQLARVLSRMHGDPGKKWTLEELARIGGMSRTAFSRFFLQTMEKTPFDYLRAYRMHLARISLAKDGCKVAALSESLGYHSEAAFRSAFKKETGRSPREYARETGKGAE